MSRSTAALLIAIMFHMLLILLFRFLMEFKPTTERQKPQEHRIKVALKDKPQSKQKSAALDNTKKPIEKTPSIPKGKQLEKLPEKLKQTPYIPAAEVAVESPPLTEKQVPKEKPVKEVSKVQTKEPIKELVNKPVYKYIEKIKSEDLNVSQKVPEKKSSLYTALSKKQKPQQQEKQKQQTGSQVGQDFQEAYGETFGKLSEGEKKYIIDNQEIMRRLTQEQLNRLAPVNIPRNLNVNTGNVIEFYLHPSGDISGLRLITPSGFDILDDTSLQTIEYSYHRYPLPEQKTMIRYKVGYYLGGRRP